MAALFLNAIKQHGGQRSTTATTDSANVSSGAPPMPTPSPSSSALVYNSDVQALAAQILNQIPSTNNSHPPATTVPESRNFKDLDATTMLPPTSRSAPTSAAAMPPPPPPAAPSSNVPAADAVGSLTDHASSTPPPVTEVTCWWWS